MIETVICSFKLYQRFMAIYIYIGAFNLNRAKQLVSEWDAIMTLNVSKFADIKHWDTYFYPQYTFTKKKNILEHVKIPKNVKRRRPEN